jgi:hypothetical protein
VKKKKPMMSLEVRRRKPMMFMESEKESHNVIEMKRRNPDHVY